MSKRKRWKAWSDHPYIVTFGLLLAVISLGFTVWFGVANLRGQAEAGLLSIRVADTVGVGIPNARVLLFHSAGAVSQTTDADGVSTFPINAATREGLRIIAEANGYEIQERQIEQGEEGPITFNLRKQAGNEASVIFRTVDASDETPVPFAEIALVTGGDILREVTDSDGFASFILISDDNAELNVRVSVNAPGYQVEEQVGTIRPEILQYILLNPTSLTLEVPQIPTAVSIESETKDGSVSGSENEESVSDLSDVGVGSGVVREQHQNGTGLRVTLQGPASQPWDGAYVAVYEQIPDVSGNPSRGERVRDGRINLQGQLDFELDSGIYAVCLDRAPGYGWSNEDCIYDVAVTSGQRSVLELQVGELEIAIVRTAGEPWEGVYYEVYTQRDDASGNPVTDRRVADGTTDNRGLANIWLTPGLYTVLINLRGYNWGDVLSGKGRLDIPVRRGESERVLIEMGRLLIGLTRPSGEPNSDAYIEVYTQRVDVNGQPTSADRVWDGRTDSAGFAMIDLTAGLYALKVGDKVLYNIPIEWGETTQTDGETFTQP